MDVFPGLIGEKEFSYFTPGDYLALRGVLNDVLAKDLSDYMSNPAANQAVVMEMQKNIGSAIESLTMHFTMSENGTFDLVRSLVPETLPTSNEVDVDELIAKLTFLEQNAPKLMTSIPGRKRIDYDTFLGMLHRVCHRMEEAGEDTTYPDIVGRVEANSFVFYSPNEKPHQTGSQIISLRKRQWQTTLRGAQYMKRCNEEGINYLERRKF